jgi:hypothetical protein
MSKLHLETDDRDEAGEFPGAIHQPRVRLDTAAITAPAIAFSGGVAVARKGASVQSEPWFRVRSGSHGIHGILQPILCNISRPCARTRQPSFARCHALGAGRFGCSIVGRGSGDAAVQAQVLETSSLFQLAHSEDLQTEWFARCEHVGRLRFVVHRSPIASRRFVLLEHNLLNLNWKIGGAARI